MSQYDAVIIGAGVVGLSAGLVCAQQGLNVAIVEAHAPIAWQPDKPDLRVYALGWTCDRNAVTKSLNGRCNHGRNHYHNRP